MQRMVVLALVLAPAEAQFGSRNIKQAGAGIGDVDLAMAGWEQLSKNPDKMQEVMASLKDPEVMAKAQEMLKDPEYMRAAKAKIDELQAKAQQRGLLDANGQPVQNNMVDNMVNMLGNQAGQGQQGSPSDDAREWELENAARHRAGELNDAELGMANLKQAMADPKLLASIREMMKDPNTMAEVQKMMQDPTFKAQAEKVAGSVDFSKMGEMMQGMRGAMGGAGAGGGVESEMERLRRENQMLKNRMGKSEL